MLRSAIKSTTLSLAVEGIARVMLSTVKNNPGKRAYQLGLIAFGSGPNDIECPDHKNMLTWAALCELEKRGDIYRVHHINWAAVTEEQHTALEIYASKGDERGHDAMMDALPRHRHAQFYFLGPID